MSLYTQYVAQHSKEEADKLVQDNPCTFCYLQNNQLATKINGFGSEHPTFMVVSDFIHKNWLSAGVPFSGPMVRPFTELLHGVGIDINEVYWTSLVKCPPCKNLKKGKETAPKKEAATYCSAYLDTEIKLKQPKVIIACGQTALDFFFPKFKMTEKRCQVLWSDKYKCNIVPIYNPESMSVTYEFDDIIRKAFEQAYNAAYHPEKLKFPEVKYLLVKDIGMLRQVAERIKQVDRIAYDLETNSITYSKAKILSVGVSWAKNTGVAWPLWIKDEEACNKLIESAPKKEQVKLRTQLDHSPVLKKFWSDSDWDEAVRLTKEIFENTECKKGGHNTFFDNLVLHYNGIEVKNYTYDTMIMKHLLDEEREKSLDYCSWIYTDKGGYKMAKEQYLKSSESNYANIPLDVLLNYNAGDASVTYELYDVFRPQIIAQGLKYEMANIRIPLQKALMEACIYGMRVDRKYLRDTAKKLDEEIKAIEEEILPYLQKYYGPNVRIVSGKEDGKPSGFEFNINSSDCLKDLLFDKMKLKVTGTTESGAPSTNESALLKLSRKGNKVADLILQRKKKFKFKTTYIDGMEDLLDENDRIHPSFNVTGTSSGRLSSSNPNCFDDKTEVLTDSGWKLFKDLNKTELLAQWKDGIITFAKPLAYIEYPYNNKMVWLHNQHTDLCVTPDHSCLLLGSTNKPVFVKACDYRDYYKQLHGGIYAGGTTHYSPEFITLMVATQADGYYKKDGMIEFLFVKERKYNRLLDAVIKLGASFTHGIKGKNQRYYIRLCVHDKYNKLLKTIMPTKVFTYDLLNLDSESRDLFIKELDYWDGCITRPLMYTSKVKQNVDVLQALLALNNRRSVTREQKGKCNTYYRFESTKNCNFSCTDNIHKEYIDYRGSVYCVTMPEHTVVVKRNGKVVITGQCQQIPRDKTIKKIFSAPDGYEIGECDFSQAELRVLAALSNDSTMKHIYEEDRDLHTELAVTAFRKPADKIEKEERSVAKVCNFLVAYQGGPDTLKANLTDAGIDITLAESKRILDTWHRKFNMASSYLSSCGRRYLNSGELVNPFGRKRRFPRAFSDEYLNSKHSREGANYQIQSTAAELAFISLINIARDVKQYGGHVISTVHDSILIEYPVEQRDNIARICKKYTWVTYPFLNGLYMKSDFACAQSWGDKKEYDVETGKFVED